METKSVNSMTPIAANASRKILSGDGAVNLGDIKTFVLNEISVTVSGLSDDLNDLADGMQASNVRIATVETKVAALDSGVKQVQESLSNITAGSLTFSALKFALYKNGAIVPEQYGYVVLEADDAGNISPQYLSAAEFQALTL
jgi:uncharacterized phage infection (PIP) family protein YhgE